MTHYQRLVRYCGAKADAKARRAIHCAMVDVVIQLSHGRAISSVATILVGSEESGNDRKGYRDRQLALVQVMCALYLLNDHLNPGCLPAVGWLA